MESPRRTTWFGIRPSLRQPATAARPAVAEASTSRRVGPTAAPLSLPGRAERLESISRAGSPRGIFRVQVEVQPGVLDNAAGADAVASIPLAMTAEFP